MTEPAGEPDPAAEPSALEVRYRRLLRVLPRAYRAVRGQEMVDTFLDSEFGADPENADLTAKFGDVGWAETLSVLALALRLRWADPAGPQRYRIRADALERIAVVFAGVLAVAAATAVLSRFWLLLVPPEGLGTDPLAASFGAAPGVWQLLDGWALVAWIPAFGLAITRRRPALACSALLAVMPAAVTVIQAIRAPGTVASAGSWAAAAAQWATVLALAALTVAAGAASPRRPASPQPTAPDPVRSHAVPRSQQLLVAMAAVTGYQLVTAVVVLLRPPAPVLYPILVAFADPTGSGTIFWVLATVLAAALLIRSARRVAPDPASLLALAALGGAATVLVLADLPLSWLAGELGGLLGGTLFVTALVQLTLVAAITVTAGVLAAHRIRRLPKVAYLPGGPSASA